MTTFIHSVRVPRLYKDAAKLLQNVRENGRGLNDGLYRLKHKNLKGIYALVAEAIKHFSQINELIEKVHLLEKEPRLDIWLARVLIFDMLWKNRQLKGDSKPIVAILKFRDELTKLKETLNVPTRIYTRVNKPRFVRVNTLKLSMEDAVSGFRDEGWNFVRFTNPNYKAFLSQVASLNSYEFMTDIHIKELLIFPVGTEFFQHQTFRDKLVALQDKASCLPVHLLNPPPNSVVLDMCAAPGMKTSYLAALMKNEGVIYAVELNRRRFESMKDNLERMQATCIKMINKDALTVNAEDCPNVEYILVDPSCSGSGMTNRVLFDDDEKPDKARLQTLARFQIVILKHALTHFPQAKRVVYSTCSIYREENEDVVEEVLTQSKNFKLVSAKRLLNNVDNFDAKEDESVEEKCMNFNYKNDFTNGFFIAVFERIESRPGEEEENVKVNKKRKRGNEGKLQESKEVESNLEECNRLQESEPKKKKGKKASTEVQAVVTETAPLKTKKKKDQINGDIGEEACLLESEPKKKKSKKVSTEVQAVATEMTPLKTKKKIDQIYEDIGEEICLQESEPKKKKGKNASTEVQAIVTEAALLKTKKKKDQINEDICLQESEPKKKKRKNEEDNTDLEVSKLPQSVDVEEANQSKTEKKKNKKHKSKVEELLPEKQEKEVDDVVQESDHKSKKNKKGKKEKIESKEETIVHEKNHKLKESEIVSSEEQAVTEDPPKKKKKKHSN